GRGFQGRLCCTRNYNNSSDPFGGDKALSGASCARLTHLYLQVSSDSWGLGGNLATVAARLIDLAMRANFSSAFECPVSPASVHTEAAAFRAVDDSAVNEVVYVGCPTLVRFDLAISDRR